MKKSNRRINTPNFGLYSSIGGNLLLSSFKDHYPLIKALFISLFFCSVPVFIYFRDLNIFLLLSFTIAGPIGGAIIFCKSKYIRAVAVNVQQNRILIKERFIGGWKRRTYKISDATVISKFHPEFSDGETGVHPEHWKVEMVIINNSSVLFRNSFKDEEECKNAMMHLVKVLHPALAQKGFDELFKKVEKEIYQLPVK